MTFIKKLAARLKARKKWREMQLVHKARRNRKLSRHERLSDLDKAHKQRVTAILRGGR